MAETKPEKHIILAAVSIDASQAFFRESNPDQFGFVSKDDGWIVHPMKRKMVEMLVVGGGWVGPDVMSMDRRYATHKASINALKAQIKKINLAV